MSRTCTSMSRASFVISSKVTGTSPRRTAPPAEAGRPPGRGRARRTSRRAAPGWRSGGTRPAAARPRGRSRSSTTALPLCGSDLDAADLADSHARHADGGLLVETRDVLELRRHTSWRLSAPDPEVFDPPDQEPRDHQNDRERTRRPSPRCSCSLPRPPGGRSPASSSVNGPCAWPSTNCRTAGSFELRNSWGGASKSSRPPKSSAIRSPIFSALAMWCVIVTIVALRLLPHLQDHLVDDVGHDRIEARVGLVEEQDLRLEGDRAREPDPAPHAARELGRPLVVDPFRGGRSRGTRGRAPGPRAAAGRSGAAETRCSRRRVIESKRAPSWNDIPNLRRSAVALEARQGPEVLAVDEAPGRVRAAAGR